MGINVTGLVEAVRGLRAMHDIERTPEVRDSLKAAADAVAQDARGRVPSRSGRAAASIRTLGGDKTYVLGGGGAVPYYGWLDFGSRKPVLGNPRKRGPWSGSGKGPQKGRFIFPAVEAQGTQMAELVGDGVIKVARKEGFH